MESDLFEGGKNYLFLSPPPQKKNFLKELNTESFCLAGEGKKKSRE